MWSGEAVNDLNPQGRLVGSASSAAGPTSRVHAVIRLWPLLLPVLVLLPGVSGFPYPSAQAEFSDLVISHYPNAVYLRQALLTWRSLPLWSPTILSGYPFAGNPLSGLWYPPGWLALLLPLPLGFNLLVILHLLWGGAGMYRLLGAEGFSWRAALFGGLAFGAMPKLYAHFGAGHVTLLYAVCWTPWLLLTRRSTQLAQNDGGYDRSGLIKAGMVLALICMADLRWAVFAGLSWATYSIYTSFQGTSNRQHAVTRLPAVLREIPRLCGVALLATALAAPLLLPTFEYTRLSTRADLRASDVLTYSLPPARLLGLLYPDLSGFQEYMLYPGAAVLLLSMLALVRGAGSRSAPFWTGLFLVALVYALGEHLPLTPLMARLPLFAWLRVPSRALFLSGTALAALSAYGLDGLLVAISSGVQRGGRLLLAGMVGFSLLLAALACWSSRSLLPGFAWGGAALLLAAVWIAARLSGRLTVSLWLAGLFGLCVLDLVGVNLSLFEMRPADQVLAEGKEAAAYLAGQGGLFRIFSPSYSLPQQTAAVHSLQLSDGVDPLQLERYVDYMRSASGVPAGGYSVTLPPFISGVPATSNAASTPDAGLLGLLNVRYLLAQFDLDVQGLALRRVFDGTRVYENLLARPRAWVQPDGAGVDVYEPVESLEWSPDRVVVRAEGPGVLTLSEIDYPGWEVWVDGELWAEYKGEGLLRTLTLPTGAHVVEFIYKPMSVYLGLGLAVVGLLVVLISSRSSLKPSPDRRLAPGGPGGEP